MESKIPNSQFFFEPEALRYPVLRLCRKENLIILLKWLELKEEGKGPSIILQWPWILIQHHRLFVARKGLRPI